MLLLLERSPSVLLLFETGQDGFVGWGQIVGWCAPDKFAQAGSMTVLERATTDNCRENDFPLITFTLCPHNLLMEVLQPDDETRAYKGVLC